MFEPVNTFDTNKNKTEYVYTTENRYRPTRGAKKTKKSQVESESEGMTNHGEASCWLTSVIQSIRASAAFKAEFAPKKDEKNEIKKDLFAIFNVAEGKNGEKRKTVSEKTIKNFKRLLIDEGLPAKMDDGYPQGKFLSFLLKKIKAKEIEYQKGSKNKKEQMLTITFSESLKKKSMQSFIKDEKIAFASPEKAPKFLPIFIDRPRLKSSSGKKKGYAKASIDPTTPLTIPVLTNGKNVEYKLVSVVICTPYWHAYTYVLEQAGWVLYDDDRVSLLKSPEKKYKDLDFSAYEDACKHSVLFIYEAAS